MVKFLRNSIKVNCFRFVFYHNDNIAHLNSFDTMNACWFKFEIHLFYFILFLLSQHQFQIFINRHRKNEQNEEFMSLRKKSLRFFFYDFTEISGTNLFVCRDSITIIIGLP